MKNIFICATGLALICLVLPENLHARGARGGGGGMRGGGGMSRGGGGGMSRGGGGRSPSMSRSAPSRNVSRPSTPSRPSGGLSRPSGGASRPSGGVSRPSGGAGGARPGGGQLGGGTRPGGGQLGGGTRPGAGTRPGSGQLGGGTRPGAGQRPSQGELKNFLDLPSSSSRPGNRPSGGQIGGAIAGGAAGGAAADFLRDNVSTRPAERPGPGGRPGGGEGPIAGNRPGTGDRPGVRPGTGDRPRPGDRPGIGEGNLAGTRPGQRPGVGYSPGRPGGLTVNNFGRIDNRQQWNNNRVARRTQVRGQIARHPIHNPGFWRDHPNWARWRWNRPYRWATWAVIGSWFPWGWSQPAYYSYGDNVYYQGGSVYYGDQVVATADEYAEQAQYIASTGTTADLADDTEWLTLGVFALTQDGEASGPQPTMYLQLAVTKEGVIAGTLYNDDTNSSQEIEGAVDKDSQRAAWVVKDQQWPIMETGIDNLTKDEAPALVHFGDGTTQQWLMVRLDEPKEQTTSP